MMQRSTLVSRVHFIFSLDLNLRAKSSLPQAAPAFTGEFLIAGWSGSFETLMLGTFLAVRGAFWRPIMPPPDLPCRRRAPRL
jgi:hypothetical protein